MVGGGGSTASTLGFHLDVHCVPSKLTHLLLKLAQGAEHGSKLNALLTYKHGSQLYQHVSPYLLPFRTPAKWGNPRMGFAGRLTRGAKAV